MKIKKKKSRNDGVSRLIVSVLTDLARGELKIEEANSVSVVARLRKAAPDLSERECRDVLDYALGEFKRISPIYETARRIAERHPQVTRADTTESIVRRAAAAGDVEALALLPRLPDLELRSFGQVKGN
jgi:hypothetical protein